jgi:hypothetical protein
VFGAIENGSNVIVDDRVREFFFRRRGWDVGKKLKKIQKGK